MVPTKENVWLVEYLTDGIDFSLVFIHHKAPNKNKNILSFKAEKNITYYRCLLPHCTENIYHAQVWSEYARALQRYSLVHNLAYSSSNLFARYSRMVGSIKKLLIFFLPAWSEDDQIQFSWKSEKPSKGKLEKVVFWWEKLAGKFVLQKMTSQGAIELYWVKESGEKIILFSIYV